MLIRWLSWYFVVPCRVTARAEAHKIVQLQSPGPRSSHRHDVVHRVGEHNTSALQTILAKVVITYAGSLACPFPGRAVVELREFPVAASLVVMTIALCSLYLSPCRVCFTVSLTCEFDTTRDYTRA